MSTTFRTGLPKTTELTLQCCGHCQQVNYPPRELCGNCLADSLQWQRVDNSGIVQSVAQLHYSLEPEYADHLPWTVGSIKLNCGPVVLAHLQPDIISGATVKLKLVQDQAENRMLVATGDDSESENRASAWLEAINFKEILA
jgi:uncharacterized OB-fold protein